MTSPKNSKTTSSGRIYTWKGEEFPSVTSILRYLPKQDALSRWAAKEAAEYAIKDFMPGKDWTQEDCIRDIKNAPFRKRDKKAEIGTVIHAAVESYLGGKSDEEIVNELPAEQVGYFYGVLHFLDAFEPVVCDVEKTVYSRSFGYAGTLDIVATGFPILSDRPVIIDVKTSKGIYPEYGAQLAAYARSDFIDEDDEEAPMYSGVQKGIVLHVTADGEFKAVPFDVEEFWPLFLAAREVWRLRGLRVGEALSV